MYSDPTKMAFFGRGAGYGSVLPELPLNQNHKSRNPKPNALNPKP